jgi:hypothetical protein
LDKLYTQTIQGGTGAQFTIEGKEDIDSTGTGTYAAGSQVTITAGTQDDKIINLDRPTYVARRIDKFDEAVANYDVIAMQVRQIGTKLANVIDRKCSAAIEAASLATGLVGNGNGHVVVNTSLEGGVAAATTSEGLGDELCESIFMAAAKIREADDMGPIYAAVSPTSYSYIVQSKKAINADYTSANGGYDSGTVAKVGGVIVFETNNLPTTAGLKGLVFCDQAAGVVKLWDVNTKITEQADFLDAKLITAYFSNGIASLRPQCAVSIKNV